MIMNKAEQKACAASDPLARSSRADQPKTTGTDSRRRGCISKPLPTVTLESPTPKPSIRTLPGGILQTENWSKSTVGAQWSMEWTSASSGVRSSASWPQRAGKTTSF